MPAPFRPRVLLIAEQANPEWVSIPLEGWSLSRALSRLCAVHVVTHQRNAPAFERAGLGARDFTALPAGRLETVLGKTVSLLRGSDNPGGPGQTLLTAFKMPAYVGFERRVWRAFSPRIGEFDLVHRLTPVSPTMPSPIAARCAGARIPFVMGPLNGGLPWPRGFDSVRLREGEWLSYFRGAHRLVPGYRSTRKHAAAIIAGSRATHAELSKAFPDKVVYVPENAIDPARFDASGPPAAPPPPLRVVFVGRLVPYKCPGILIEAAAPLVREGRVQLEIIGDGEELPSLRKLAAREQLPETIFSGWVKHADLEARLSRAHVFAFPSVREFGGAVVLESMAAGLVPVVMDYGGPAELVSPQTGFTVPMGPQPHIVQRFRALLDELSRDPKRLAAMAPRARQRVLEHFTWDAKAAQVLDVYRWVLGQGPKPSLPMPIPDQGLYAS